MKRTWMDAMDCHRHHDALFARHQEAVLRLQLDEASVLFTAYRTALAGHMEAEESHVLPLYQARGGERPGGGLDLFRFEHRKLTAQLHAIEAALLALRDLPEGKLPAAAIALLDRECAYKNLMAHHDTRERTMLYPYLDTVTTEAERDAVLAYLADT